MMTLQLELVLCRKHWKRHRRELKAQLDTRKMLSIRQCDYRHRRVVYVMRRRILEGDNIKPEIERLLRAKVHELTTLPSKNNPKFVEDSRLFSRLIRKKLKRLVRKRKIVCAMRRRWSWLKKLTQRKSVRLALMICVELSAKLHGGVGHIVDATFGKYATFARRNSLAKCWTT